MGWDLADYVIAAVLLSGAGLTYKLVASRGSDIAYRIGLGIALATGLILVWMNLAVGLIGSEDNPANLMYVGVLVIGIVAAVIGAFRPRGMTRALFATAIAQALVPVIAFIVWRPSVSTSDQMIGVAGVFAVNALFVVLFVVSALFFRHASVKSQE